MIGGLRILLKFYQDYEAFALVIFALIVTVTLCSNHLSASQLL